MLSIYKASAGSGKTFQLVVEYLKLVIKKPDNYKHILAVTFTNKATAEMKNRILEQLYKLAENQESDYLSVLTSDLDLTMVEVRKRAKLTLKNLLHDYSRFSVSTIDTFTQRIIRSFNRELGIAPDFTLELDDDLILEEAIDRLLSKIHTDKKLLRWLMDFSKDKITENRSQYVADDIKMLGKELFKENFGLFFSDTGHEIYTRENLELLKSELNKIIIPFDSFLFKKGKESIQIISENGFTIDDFSNKNAGIAGFLNALSESKLVDPTEKIRVKLAYENPESWITKTHNKKAELLDLTEKKLHPVLVEIVDFYQSKHEEYNTASEVKSQLQLLGILTDLKQEIRDLLLEKGVLRLSESNILLNRIIENSDTPFIYEKTGTKYKYFMLDEFQDTSTLQWNNFKPLILNSLSQGYNSLLVGDAKQSIYRWRNGDWRILAEQVNSDFPSFTINEVVLNKNWRSNQNVIDFNNSVLQCLKQVFENELFKNQEDPYWQILTNRFSGLYRDIYQEKGKPDQENKGFVRVGFIDKEEFEFNSILKCIAEVKELQDKGIKASEIAILIRKNSQGPAIIKEFFTEALKPENKKYKLSVLSNESFFLKASNAVRLVLQVIQLLIDPTHKIAKVAVIQAYNSDLKTLESEKKTEIKNTESLNQDIEIQANLLTPGYEQIFENQIEPILDKLRLKIIQTSLNETITEICSVFNLFEIPEELPFLQALIDKSGELKHSLSNDLSNFLHWWENKGKETPVSVNENVDSIRLITIHKSKGLEYKAVIVPFMNWGTGWGSNQSPMLWCYVDKEPFNMFPSLPVKGKKILGKTLFKKQYFEELANTYIDNMNLIYVALTRAKSVLIVHCDKMEEKASNKKEESSAKSVSHLMKKALDEMSLSDVFEQCWNAEKDVFQLGEIPESFMNVNSDVSEKIYRYAFTNFDNRLQLRITDENFILNEGKTRSLKNRGKIIHEILSRIETTDDLEKSLLVALNEGAVSLSEAKTIREYLEKSFLNKQIEHWFNGSYKILNERSILTKTHNYRPDRIMVSDSDALVIDYKSGDSKSEDYQKQVTRYARILKDAGYKSVKGYLWYLNFNEVEKVCEI